MPGPTTARPVPVRTLYRSISDEGRMVPAFEAVVFRDGIAYDVSVSVDIRLVERHVADAPDEWADTIGNPAYDNTHRTDDGIVFRLARRREG